MLKRFQVLNSQVVDTLKSSDPCLSVAFFALHYGYDVDFHPLHNPQWVVGAKEHEEYLLEQATQLVLSVKEIKL